MGATVAVGVKDRPIRGPRDSYISTLSDFQTRYVVFWDTQADRGWLVNANTALLHLSRASWRRIQEGPLSSQVIHSWSDLHVPTEKTEHDADTAIKILADESNRGLELWKDAVQKEPIISRKPDGSFESVVKEKTTYYCFQHLVESIANVLEKLCDHLLDISQDGISLMCRVQYHLDGWDFNDVIGNKAFNPKVATLKAFGAGWADLIDDIKAVVIHGKGFGEMIRPAPTGGMCKLWSQLPPERYYLGTTVSDLRRIADEYGDWDTVPVQITQRLHWRSSRGARGRCQCEAAPHEHTDLTQSLSRERRASAKDQQVPAIWPDGAVIFTHNVTLPFSSWYSSRAKLSATQSGTSIDSHASVARFNSALTISNEDSTEGPTSQVSSQDQMRSASSQTSADRLSGSEPGPGSHDVSNKRKRLSFVPPLPTKMPKLCRSMLETRPSKDDRSE